QGRAQGRRPLGSAPRAPFGARITFCGVAAGLSIDEITKRTSMSRARHLIERMARRARGSGRGQRGYTLVELLVVLLILGIVLAALMGAWVTAMHAEM